MCFGFKDWAPETMAEPQACAFWSGDVSGREVEGKSALQGGTSSRRGTAQQREVRGDGAPNQGWQVSTGEAGSSQRRVAGARQRCQALPGNWCAWDGAGHCRGRLFVRLAVTHRFPAGAAGQAGCSELRGGRPRVQLGALGQCSTGLQDGAQLLRLIIGGGVGEELCGAGNADARGAGG